MKGSDKPYILSPTEWKPYAQPIEGESLPGVEEMSNKIRRELENNIEEKDLDIFPTLPERLSGENTYEIVVDPLAFYVPYHYNSREWGIYFRVNRMMPLFESMLRSYGAYLGVKSIDDAIGVFNVYLAYIYWHELTHHIVEDICTLRGSGYPILSRTEEEGLAEWHGLVTAERRISLPYRPYKRLRLFGSRLFRSRRFSYVDRRKILSVIYYYLGRDRDPIYRPVVRRSVVNTLGLLWTPVREASVRGGYVYIVNNQEVYPRIYLTTY